MGRRRRAATTVPDRGDTRDPRRDRARPDPVDQAELLGLPARRLHRGRVLGRIAQLDGESIDLLEISGGTYESPAMTGSAADSTRRREAYFLEFADAVREITTVPL